MHSSDIGRATRCPRELASGTIPEQKLTLHPAPKTKAYSRRRGAASSRAHFSLDRLDPRDLEDTKLETVFTGQDRDEKDIKYFFNLFEYTLFYRNKFVSEAVIWLGIFQITYSNILHNTSLIK